MHCSRVLGIYLNTVLKSLTSEKIQLEQDNQELTWFYRIDAAANMPAQFWRNAAPENHFLDIKMFSTFLEKEKGRKWAVFGASPLTQKSVSCLFFFLAHATPKRERERKKRFSHTHTKYFVPIVLRFFFEVIILLYKLSTYT